MGMVVILRVYDRCQAELHDDLKDRPEARWVFKLRIAHLSCAEPATSGVPSGCMTAIACTSVGSV